MARLGLLPLVLLAAWPATPGHRVTGIVHDPNAGVRLAGAVVQAVRVDPSATFTAVTDSLGRFELSDLPDGRYAIGFQHRALAALNIDSPIDAFELGADSVVRINLAVPSGAALREMLCGKSDAKARDGVLAGFVVTARDDQPLAGARIVARWTEVGINRGKIGPVARDTSATVSDDGTYHMCGVPSDAPVNVEVRAAGQREIEGEVFIPLASVVRRDFRMADSATTVGSGVLAGRLLREDGEGIASGRVVIPALSREARVQDGNFSLTQLPAGTWAVEARAIGYEPLSALMEVADQASMPARITLAKEAQKLAAVTVVGKASREVKTLEEIRQRSLTSAGTQFMPGNSWLKAAFDPGDVMRGARGFSVKSPTKVEGRPYFDSKGRQLPCSTSNGGLRGDRNELKEVAVYIDGMRTPGGLETLNNDLRMDQVLAIETYPDVTTAPFIWRNSATCAVIAVWTKR